MRTYEDNYYFSLPRFRNGTPVTLVSIPRNSSSHDPILAPYPDWDSNVGEDCSTLQSIRGMEIDNKNGILWVLDGVRSNGISSNCPVKLVLLDLNDNGNIVHTYTFPENVSSRGNAYLSEIALEVGDGFAFITDSNNDSPGLIVYSRSDDRAWKLFDNDSMTRTTDQLEFEANDDEVTLELAISIFGVTLSPATLDGDDRYLYYTVSSGRDIYSVPLQLLKDPDNFESSDRWKDHISVVGRKEEGSVPSSDIIMDTNSTLWLTYIQAHGLAKLRDGDDETRLVYSDDETFVWPEAFSYDDVNYMYVTSNKYAYIMFNSSREMPDVDSEEYVYFVTRFYTQAESYINSNL